MLVCVLIAFLICVLLTPLVIVLCKKFNWYDEVDPRKVHKGLIPRLGGFGVFVSFIIAMFIHAVFFSKTDFHYAIPACLGGFIIFLFGVIDDFMNLRAKLKFLIQIVATLIVSCSSLYLDCFLGIQIPPLLGRAITFSWILFLVNAYNLIDGLDLLCGGLSFLTLLSGGILMIHSGQPLGELYVVLCASIFAFLLFNKPPAKIFLGDCGSQTLGFTIAMIPLFPMEGSMQHTKFIVAILLTSIPVSDVVAAVLRRLREHRSFFSADRAHIHHKLVNIGFSKVVTAVILLFIQVFICFAALATLFTSKTKDSVILLCVSLMLVWCFFITLHYVNRTVNMKHLGLLDEAPQQEH